METTNSRITVVIPIYNRVGYLPRTLQSVLIAAGQCRSYVPTIILVDNGSVDGSYEYIQQFRKRHSDFRIIVAQENRKGASFARNKGLELCDTEYIYFFDSDDEFSADFFTKTDWLYKASDNYDMIMLTTAQCIGDRTQTRSFKQTEHPAMQILSGMLNTQAMLFRTIFLRKIGGWNTGLLTWDDWELGVRALFAHPKSIWYTQTPFHRIFIHPDSITGNNFSERMDYIEKALKAVARIIQDIPDTDSCKRAASKALFYRMKILSGSLLSENNPKAANRVDVLASEIQPFPSFPSKIAGSILKSYTAHGGRGGWRIAQAITI
ncbi:MAG: glycosyltransferase family 2 protein [Bacteroides sp.]|nr:glycosyltransferase family 2 protein [Roseburia sp.]MCM1346942.1 glycosyltransferase family 2 protein [Bacteroides sp.]MCM1421513.1 glycosyltransferase family 2 protein [Bacteroides sp.]